MPGGDANDWFKDKTDDEIRVHLDNGRIVPRTGDDGGAKAKPIGDNAGERAKHLPYILFSEVAPILSNQWMIKRVLPRHGLVTIYGPSGEGKTFVALDLLMHVARGVAWRGHHTRRGAVLYLAPDGGAIVRNRIEAYRRHHAIDGTCDFVLMPCPVDLLGKLNAGDVGKVLALIAHLERVHGLRIVVVCVDTVSRSMPGGDENQPADMTKFIDNLAKVQNGDDRLLIGIHHTPKSDTATLRGHSSLHGACDCEINVHDRTIKVVKQRDGADGAEFAFDLAVVELGTDDDGDLVTSCVAVPAAATRPAASGKKLTADEQGWLNDITNMFATPGYTQEVVPMQGMPPVIGATRDATRNFFITVGRVGVALDVALTATERSSMRRMLNRLKDKGKIGIYGNWIWLTEASVA